MRLELTGFRNYVADRVSLRLEPTPTTLRMIPELFVGAPGILAIEQVVSPFSIPQCIGLQWPSDSGLAAVAELTLGSLAAPGALD